jgi:hypothetical protein
MATLGSRILTLRRIAHGLLLLLGVTHRLLLLLGVTHRLLLLLGVTHLLLLGVAHLLLGVAHLLLGVAHGLLLLRVAQGLLLLGVAHGLLLLLRREHARHHHLLLRHGARHSVAHGRMLHRLLMWVHCATHECPKGVSAKCNLLRHGGEPL